MNWNPFELFKKQYEPFGINEDMASQNNINLSNTHNTARSLFVNISLENEFKRLQHQMWHENNSSCTNDTQNYNNNGF